MPATINSETKELARLYGIDLSSLPPISTTPQMAAALGMTVTALEQDRHRRQGPTIPYVKIGNRVRYLRSDVVRYLLSNRRGGAA